MKIKPKVAAVEKPRCIHMVLCKGDATSMAKMVTKPLPHKIYGLSRLETTGTEEDKEEQ